MSAAFPSRIVLFGAGKMGGAMLEGWLERGLPPDAVDVIEQYPSERIKALQARNGLRLNPELSAARAPEILILAIKPQSLDAAAADLAFLAQAGTLVISILAGKTIADLKARMPEAMAFIRAMPNTPAAVGRGITGAAVSTGVSAGQKQQAEQLLSAVGAVEWAADEALIDAVTAVSGSGPAYVFYLTECLARAGAAAGLPADMAMRLARATVEGAGELMYQDSETPPATLRENVTSPGGTTAAALEVLMAEGGLDPLMREAVAAAKRRAEELSG